MARRNNLTALAALGTLGYMLSKKGDKKDDKKEGKKTEEYRADPYGAMSQAERDARPSIEELDQQKRAKEQGKKQLSGDAYMAEYYAKKERNPQAVQDADNPRVSSPASKPTVSASKPSASKPSKATTSSTSRDYQAEQDADNPRGSRSMVMFPGTPDMRGATSAAGAPMRGQRSDAGTSPIVQSGRREDEEAVKTDPVDETKLSLSERIRLSRERARSGSSPTDYRPVNERFGMKRGGKVKKMASGGMTSSVSSASKRADGIATKGKTRGKIC